MAQNRIDGRGGADAIGVHLEATGAFVDDNVIRGGCGNRTRGVVADDAFARLQNNRIFAGQCNGDTGSSFVALFVRAAGGTNELDVHSNHLDGDAGPFACTSSALQLAAGATAPTLPLGIYRNNILRAGQCATRIHVVETTAATDPRIFENNDLDPFASPTALYRDEATTDLQTLPPVNALPGATANLSTDADFVAYPTDLHLKPTSPCIAAGTPTGAPALDMDGTPRPTPPSIGPDDP